MGRFRYLVLFLVPGSLCGRTELSSCTETADWQVRLGKKLLEAVPWPTYLHLKYQQVTVAMQKATWNFVAGGFIPGQTGRDCGAKKRVKEVRRSKPWGYNAFTDAIWGPILAASVVGATLMIVLGFILLPVLERHSSFIEDEWYQEEFSERANSICWC